MIIRGAKITCRSLALLAVLIVILIYKINNLYALQAVQENVPLTQFQLIARADLVVHSEVLDGNNRLARMRIIETFRGTPPGETLRLDFRDLNFERRGQEVVQFTAGEQYVLFLERPQWRKPSENKQDIFLLYHGRRGRYLLPAEGTGIPLEAVRELSALVGRTPEDQIAGLRSLVARDNPVLREAALQEVARLRAATPADFPVLVRLLGDTNPRIRTSSLALIGSVMGQAATEEIEVEKRTTLEACRAVARNDPSEDVRVAAVRVLGAWQVHDDVAADLGAIATNDVSQMVRYEAQRILYAWGMTGQGRKR